MTEDDYDARADSAACYALWIELMRAEYLARQQEERGE